MSAGSQHVAAAYHRRRGSLRKRCPLCGKLRKHREPPGDQGGEVHPRRPPWVWTPWGSACGWCFARARGVALSPAATLGMRVYRAAIEGGFRPGTR